MLRKVKKCESDIQTYLLFQQIGYTKCFLWLFDVQVTTVDKFQGQQNDFILLSLVRTRFVGHLRDVRRLVVAMSRARLGLYVFCRRSLFEQCYELQPTFQLLLRRPDRLGLNLNETTPFTVRDVEDTGPISFVSGVEEMGGIINFKLHQVYQVCFPPPHLFCLSPILNSVLLRNISTNPKPVSFFSYCIPLC